MSERSAWSDDASFIGEWLEATRPVRQRAPWLRWRHSTDSFAASVSVSC
jgi:hypothetical protein